MPPIYKPRFRWDYRHGVWRHDALRPRAAADGTIGHRFAFAPLDFAHMHRSFRYGGCGVTLKGLFRYSTTNASFNADQEHTGTGKRPASLAWSVVLPTLDLKPQQGDN
jgi:hypothetical protein